MTQLPSNAASALRPPHSSVFTAVKVVTQPFINGGSPARRWRRPTCGRLAMGPPFATAPVASAGAAPMDSSSRAKNVRSRSRRLQPDALEAAKRAQQWHARRAGLANDRRSRERMLLAHLGGLGKGHATGPSTGEGKVNSHNSAVG